MMMPGLTLEAPGAHDVRCHLQSGVTGDGAGGHDHAEQTVKLCRLSVQGLPRRGMRVMWPSCRLLRRRPFTVAG